MSKTIKLRNICLGEGIPKICLPMVATTHEELLLEIATIKTLSPDLVEWRADCFIGIQEPGIASQILGELRTNLGEIPIIFTMRTKRENGGFSGTSEAYARLNMEIARTRIPDLLDIELDTSTSVLRLLVAGIHACGVKIIMSNHDFDTTPPYVELVARLRKMHSWGADVIKLAVMPNSPTDVLTLLKATREVVNDDKGPVVSMSMGKLGIISRISGEVFGSAITFAIGKTSSAPGQIPIQELQRILNILH